MVSEQQRPARLVIIDDEPSVGETLSEVLAQAGYTVNLARSATEAVAYFAQDRVDAALVERYLDHTDGLALLEDLRRQQPACRMIVLTAYPSAASLAEAQRRGAVDYLTKPCDLDELQAVLAQAVQRPASDVASTPGPGLLGRLAAGLQSHVEQTAAGLWGSSADPALASSAP